MNEKLLRAEYVAPTLMRSGIDPATLEPNPSPVDRLNIALRHACDAAKMITSDRDQLEGIRATLYVNFVSKDCHGIRFKSEEIEGWSTTKLLYEILLKLHDEIDRLRTNLSLAQQR